MLPIKLKHDQNRFTCLTLMHMLLPEIGLNDLKMSSGECRWNGLLYLPTISLHEFQKGDIILWRNDGKPQHAAIVISRDGGKFFEMREESVIYQRKTNLHFPWEIHRPSRIVVP